MNNTTQINNQSDSSKWKQIFNKVPEVTAYFWIIKVLGTTVGETAADFLNVNLNFGLTGTSLVTGVLLLIALFFQFRSKKYTPIFYWITVVLISIFGTLVTDNLTDKLNIPLETSTLIFSALLAITFAIWYKSEKTLSIHSITTRKREVFYWLTILFTFALGTASGDLMAEGLGLGYLLTGIIVAVTIGALSTAWKLGLNSILSFWLIYIFTRPLGASLGDLLSQPHIHGGLGLGATVTSAIFLCAIFALIIFLTATKKDVTTEEISRKNENKKTERGDVLLQTSLTLIILVSIAFGGYYFRHAALQINEKAPAVSTDVSSNTSPLGDLSTFRIITQDTLDLINKGDITSANNRINDLEYEWDNAQARLKQKNTAEWTKIDGKIDIVLRNLRSTHPDLSTSKASLEALLLVLN